MKKFLSVFLSVIIIMSAFGVSAYNADISKAAEETASFLKENIKNPTVSSAGGEWTVFGLARGGFLDENYKNTYYRNLVNVLNDKNGVLHDKKYTEYSRVILTLSAMGKSVDFVGDYNLFLPLMEFDKVCAQGVNGAIWALIAINSTILGSEEIREKYVQEILSSEIKGGGWALSKDSKEPESDMTAMALSALAPYKNNTGVKDAVNRGIAVLSSMQNENGGYTLFGEENAESVCQVITALSTLGISCEDERFIKGGNTLVSNLMKFCLSNGGFSHTIGGEADIMTTEQALYALVSLKRFKNNEPSLFDMSDVVYEENEGGYEATGIVKPEIKFPGKTFNDIKGHKNQKAIEALCERGIINGMNESEFAPDKKMTRAEFATIVVKALSLVNTGSTEQVFKDATANDWYTPFVNAAYFNNIVKGTGSDTFSPSATITKEAALVMLMRSADLAGIYRETDREYQKNVLSAFPDYINVSDWAFEAVSYSYDNDIADNNDMVIDPKREITRCEIAQMIYNLLNKAALL